MRLAIIFCSNRYFRKHSNPINNFLTQEEFLKLQDSQHVQIQFQILNFLVHQFLLVSNSKEIHLILKGH